MVLFLLIIVSKFSKKKLSILFILNMILKSIWFIEAEIRNWEKILMNSSSLFYFIVNYK